jgi:hypothetical protein
MLNPDPTIKQFLDNFQKNLRGEPIFRLIWSEDSFEVRRGVFNDYNGLIFLRTEAAVRRVPKYNYIKDRWILEKWVSPEECFTPELPESTQGSYEPCFVFEDAKRNPLPVTRKVVEFLVNWANGKVRSMSNSERKTLESSIEEKEIQDFMDALEVSPITNALHMKEGVTVV